MSWVLLCGLAGVLGFALAVALARTAELRRMQRSLDERDQAERVGSSEAQLQHPVVDLSRCLGCATCVAVCPEDGVLEIVHGQAVVVNGARCQGISACERECPVGAITVTLGDLSERDDVPALRRPRGRRNAGTVPRGRGHGARPDQDGHRARHGRRGRGRAARAAPAQRLGQPGRRGAVLDLCIVGAGPAGLACSLEAKRHGLSFVTLDQEEGLGGTVAKYPRRKLVLTQPVELPLHGRLDRRSYTKEELMELWHEVAEEHELPIHGGQVFQELARDADGLFVVRTKTSTYVARNVCLALGRRGSPRKLGVPGEELPKVAYSLLDANSYQDRRMLVVGGGDSASRPPWVSRSSRATRSRSRTARRPSSASASATRTGCVATSTSSGYASSSTAR